MAKVLVVEDDESLSAIYNTILTKEGYAVEQANDGIEALKKVRSFNPDIILLDIRMPNMDGIEFLRQFDLAHSNSNAKVVVFSNIEQTEQLDNAYKLGASRYILKSSMSPKQLSDLIRDTLKKNE